MKEFSTWFHNILEEAEITDSRYPIKGMNVWLPNGFKIRKHTLNILRDLLDKEHEEVLFPLLIPEDELAKEAIHVKGFEEEVYWVTKGGLTELNKKMALRPTSETAMYPMFNLWVRSHIDLPMKFYQIVNTFRYETKHTRPLIRVREITTFKEAHTVHSTAEDAENQVKKAVDLYKDFFDILGIPYILTKRPSWDKFPGADYTLAFDTMLPDGKTLQIGTIHNLGTTFAKTFDITFEDEDGDHKYVYQTCYGLSDRVIASVIGVHGDESGLILPSEIAPYQVVIIPIIFKKGGDEVITACNKIKNELEEAGIRVILDNSDKRPGKKYYKWELNGVPIRIELGPKDLKNNNAIFVRRDTKEKITISLEENIVLKIKELTSEINKNLYIKSNEKMQSRIRDVKSLNEIKEILEKERGIISIPWCGHEECGKQIEEITNIDILGTDETKIVDGNCINCGDKAKFKTFMAKTY